MQFLQVFYKESNKSLSPFVLKTLREGVWQKLNETSFIFYKDI